MWPPRFAPQTGHPPAHSGARLSSTLPRRPSHLSSQGQGSGRPNFGPRSSSLSNASKTSVTSGHHAGSGLRQEIAIGVPDTKDPLEVLNGILNVVPGDAEKATHTKRPDVLVEEIDFGGKSLQDFIMDSPKPDEAAVTLQPPEDYEQDKARFEDLHSSISACDETLKSVESSLARFQQDLGNVSAEIESLQNRSIALNRRLENRKVVEKVLGPAVEEITIAPHLVKKLASGPIDATWIQALDTLEKRYKATETKFEGSADVRAIQDVKPLLEDLTARVVERIRDFFIAQIKALRSPNINAQIIQQQGFTAFKDVYAFISRMKPSLAEQLLHAYSNTMRWYYLSNFKRYRQALEKMQVYAVDKLDAVGVDQVAPKGGSNTAAGPQRSPAALVLGRRADLLKKAEYAALPAHLATDSKQPSYIEAPFRALSTAIADNASAEYAFLSAFLPPSTSFASISRTFGTIFNDTFELGHAHTKHVIENSHDCLGLLLCVRINQHHAFVLQRRKCPVADGWINGNNMLLWPRFQQGMDCHVESVKKYTNQLSSSAFGSKATLFLTSGARGSGDDGKGSANTAPHSLTQRFGQLLQGLVSLNDPAIMAASDTANAAGGSSTDSEPVGRSLVRLRGEMEAFLAKAARTVGTHQSRRDRFLSNNYSLIVTILGDARGPMAEEQRAWFTQRRDSVTNDVAASSR